ncbi:MAG: hypothetical protein M3Z32_03330 [Acidobacteriota bacterium]|nr:hypothetical protein [Acidobacteriota bacterium]
MPIPAQETDAPCVPHASGLTKFFTNQVAGHQRPPVAVSLYDRLDHSLVDILKFRRYHEQLEPSTLHGPFNSGRSGCQLACSTVLN